MSDSGQPSVLIIYTGGTIGMVESDDGNYLVPFDFANLTRQVPELEKLKIHLEGHSFDRPIDSSDMHPGIWAQIAETIYNEYDQHDGFVILHGSDTLAYTASALSFMLENLSKPVILTGAQLPIGVIRSDGKENLITAIEIAAARENGKPIVREVAIYFEHNLYRGNRTHKSSAEDFEAFVSPNYSLLAEVGVHIRYNHEALRKANGNKLTICTNMDTSVTVLSLFPGITRNVVEQVLKTPDLKGLILHTFGSGNAPTQNWFLDILKAAIGDGLVVLNITQCTTGEVEQGRYETSSGLKKIGVIGGGDMTLEAGITKLMYLFGQEKDSSTVREKITRSLRGEITERKIS